MYSFQNNTDNLYQHISLFHLPYSTEASYYWLKQQALKFGLLHVSILRPVLDLFCDLEVSIPLIIECVCISHSVCSLRFLLTFYFPINNRCHLFCCLLQVSISLVEKMVNIYVSIFCIKTSKFKEGKMRNIPTFILNFI